MAHEIEKFAFRGAREALWHRVGNQMQKGQSIEDWQEKSGLLWTAEKSTAWAKRPDGTFVPVEGQYFLTRSDTGAPLGYVSSHYKPVQPGEILEWFRRYVQCDDRFEIDTAGCLKKGAVAFATAVYNGPSDVGGEQHLARLLMTTTFDSSACTTNQGTMDRVICWNTLRIALTGDTRAVVKTSHSARFDADRVRSELANIAASVDSYREMGEAMMRVEMGGRDVSALFKSLLDIPFDIPRAEISTRKANIFDDLSRAYRQTVEEGTAANTPWTALNAVTRYVDHNRVARGSTDADRLYSATFGSGDSMKKQATELLRKFTDTARPNAGIAVPADFLASAETRLATA